MSFFFSQPAAVIHKFATQIVRLYFHISKVMPEWLHLQSDVVFLKMPETTLLQDGVTLTCAAPSEFSPSIVTAYLALLTKGNAVNVPSASRLMGAYRWAIIQVPGSGQVVSAGALKKTSLNQAYYSTLFSPRKASLSQTFSTRRFPFDLGYLVTASDFRRRNYCTMVMDALLAQCSHEGVLATTQDPGIQRKLLHRSFERRGAHWQAENGGTLALYLRPVDKF